MATNVTRAAVYNGGATFSSLGRFSKSPSQPNDRGKTLDRGKRFVPKTELHEHRSI